MVTFSREQAEASAIEQISGALISETIGLALDAAMWSNFAGDATRPPGLFANANTDSLTPVAGGGSNAMLGDIGNLFDSLTKYYAGKTPIFIAAPRLASTLKLTAGPHWDYPVVSSAALEATKTLVALELVHVRVHRDLLKVLMKTEHRSDYILTTKTGKPFDKTVLSKAIKARLREIGGENYTLHGLRKAAGVRLAEAGASVPMIMSILGHRSPGMSLFYCREANKRELSDSAMKLWERAA